MYLTPFSFFRDLKFNQIQVRAKKNVIPKILNKFCPRSALNSSTTVTSSHGHERARNGDEVGQKY